VSAAYVTAKVRVRYAEKGGYRYCSTCLHLLRPVYAGVEHLQCQQIGVMNDPDADVLPGAHCRAWKGRM
jgi:hypothetical protein